MQPTSRPQQSNAEILAQVAEVEPLRQASREVVRELGMLDERQLGIGMTASQCHALLEIDRAGPLPVVDLAERLRLDKSAMSRTLQHLASRHLVRMTHDTGDRRIRRAALTPAGRRKVHSIHERAASQVDAALRQMSADERATVLRGMALYARALRRARWVREVEIREITTADDPRLADIIRRVMTEHGAVGPGFAIVDPEVSAMSDAYSGVAERPARYYVLDRGGVVIGGAGFAQLTGGEPDTCELRKMYLEPSARGGGLGKRLLQHVLRAARDAGYRRCYLETMATMQRARALYESVGFTQLPGPQGCTGHYGCDAWYARSLL